MSHMQEKWILYRVPGANLLMIAKNILIIISFSYHLVNKISINFQNALGWSSSSFSSSTSETLLSTYGNQILLTQIHSCKELDSLDSSSSSLLHYSITILPKISIRTSSSFDHYWRLRFLFVSLTVSLIIGFLEQRTIVIFKFIFFRIRTFRYCRLYI